MNNTSFEDIVTLYEFDEELRGLFFKYLCHIEIKLRSSISYYFCRKHGERQEEYLNPANYSKLLFCKWVVSSNLLQAML